MEMHNEEALARQRFELRRRMLEIDKDDATWRCEQYRRLLERFGGDAGSPPQRSQPESGQPITGSSSSQPATPSGPIPQRQQVLPSVQQDDSEHGRHQGSVFNLVCIWIHRLKHLTCPAGHLHRLSWYHQG